jgi:hypothetical protein
MVLKILGCDAVVSGWWVPTFQGNILFPCSGLREAQVSLFKLTHISQTLNL